MLKDVALSFLNVPYKWGGAHPSDGLDCSGFVQEVLRSVLVLPKLDFTAQSLHDYFVIHGISNEKDLGSLVFYGISTNKITHVSMCLNGHQVIEAGGGGSSTTNTVEAIKAQAFVRIRPLIHRRDIVAIIKPDYPEWAR